MYGRVECATWAISQSIKPFLGYIISIACCKYTLLH